VADFTVRRNTLGGVEVDATPGVSTATHEALNDLAHDPLTTFDGGTLVIAAVNGRFRLTPIPGSEDDTAGTIVVNVTIEAAPSEGWQTETSLVTAECTDCAATFEAVTEAADHYGTTGHVVLWEVDRKVWIGQPPES
jgi:hypothetical protein